jgi:hypothetical protein
MAASSGSPIKNDGAGNTNLLIGVSATFQKPPGHRVTGSADYYET